MSATYQFIITLTVDDPKELERAAKAEALLTMTEGEWSKRRSFNPVYNDIRMLLTPEVPQRGLVIDDADLTFVCGDPQ